MADGAVAAATREFCATIVELHARGWCSGTGGNFSATLAREPLDLLITPSGHDKGALAPEDLLRVGDDGRVRAGDGRPSAETLIHVEIVRATGAASVLHTHSVPGTLLGEHYLERGLTLTGYEMLKGLEGVRTHEARVDVPIFANDQEIPTLAGRVAELLAERPELHGFLIAGHGLYTWGQSIAQARRHVEIFEFLFDCVARRTRFEPWV